nr:RepB [Shuttle vector pG108]AVN57617.2 RepB [Shuttle vector pG106]UTD45288.1 putative plasmid replication protein [Shuttle vector pG106-KA]
MTDNSNISHDVFLSKNLYLESNETFEYRSLKPFEFFQIIFGSCDHNDPQCPIYPFEKELCQEYIDWRAQQAGRKSKSKAGKKAIYNPAQPFRYNALVQAVYSVEPDAGRANDNGRRSKTWVVVGDATSEDDIKVCGWDSLEELMGRYKFVVTTPATYVGRRRFKSNARYLYALAFDLDEVGVPEMSEVIHQQTIGMTPQANIIVNSGDGIHLYYILAKPMPLYPKVYETLTNIKKALTRLIWNKASSRTGEDNQVQIQPIIQPFRVPGSRTKHGDIVTAWHNADAPLHTIEELNRFASKPTLKYLNSGVSQEQAQALDKGAYSTNRLTKARAKELYPDWYQKRIVEGAPRKTWHVHRGLYEWWLHMLWTNEKVAVGHRYHCIMFLAVYAKKCNVPFDILKRDALELVPRMEALTGNTGRHFSVQDALDALKAYKESSETYPRQLIEDRSGLRIEPNKRNGRPQDLHLKLARGSRDILQEAKGRKDWREGNGRPKGSIVLAEDSPQYAKVQEWRDRNPNSNNKSRCARETGLSRPTVRKWWQSPWETL